MYNTLRGLKKLIQQKFLNFDLKYMRKIKTVIEKVLLNLYQCKKVLFLQFFTEWSDKLVKLRVGLTWVFHKIFSLTYLRFETFSEYFVFLFIVVFYKINKFKCPSERFAQTFTQIQVQQMNSHPQHNVITALVQKHYQELSNK